MSVLNKAKQHFHSVLAQELISIDIPEWETKIWFKAASTFQQEQKIIELHGKGKLVEALVETLIIKALNEDGTKVFTPADKPVLMREVDPEIIIRIVTAMNEAKEAAKEDLGN